MAVADLSQVINQDHSMPMKAKDRKWKKITLQRTHKDLAKFDSNKDPDFLKVLSCINQCLEFTNYERALERHSLFFTHIGRSYLIGMSATSTDYNQPSRLPKELQRGLKQG